MNTLNFLSLSSVQAAPIIGGLSQLLADFQVYYTNLRNFHWNIQGREFFGLHKQFEELYDSVNAKIDEIAERILQLGSVPEHRFSVYLRQSRIAELPAEHSGQAALGHILSTLKILMTQEREVLAAAQDAGDEVTAALMSDYLTGQEKQVWMFCALMS